MAFAQGVSAGASALTGGLGAGVAAGRNRLFQQQLAEEQRQFDALSGHREAQLTLLGIEAKRAETSMKVMEALMQKMEASEEARAAADDELRRNARKFFNAGIGRQLRETAGMEVSDPLYLRAQEMFAKDIRGGVDLQAANQSVLNSIVSGTFPGIGAFGTPPPRPGGTLPPFDLTEGIDPNTPRGVAQAAQLAQFQQRAELTERTREGLAARMAQTMARQSVRSPDTVEQILEQFGISTFDEIASLPIDQILQMQAALDQQARVGPLDPSIITGPTLLRINRR